MNFFEVITNLLKQKRTENMIESEYPLDWYGNTPAPAIGDRVMVHGDYADYMGCVTDIYAPTERVQVWIDERSAAVWIDADRVEVVLTAAAVEFTNYAFSELAMIAA